MNNDNQIAITPSMQKVMEEYDKTIQDDSKLPNWIYMDDSHKVADPSALGMEILSEYEFLYVQSGKDDISLYQYSEKLGYWQPINKQTVKLIISDKLTSQMVWKAKVANDTEKFVLTGIKIKSVEDTIQKINPELIHFVNGTYSLETGQLEPNKPENYFFNGRKYALDMTNSKTPLTDKWLSESTGDAKKFLMEYIGYCFYKSYQPFQKFTILLADGGDGKSTFFNWFDRALGEDNISNVTLKALTDPKDKFSTSELYDKSANYYADISSGLIEDASLIKGLTGDDKTSIQAKFQNGHRSMMYAKLFFGANELPAFKDNSRGFERRPCIVEFHNISDFSKRFSMKEIYKEIPAFVYKCLLAFNEAMKRGSLSETKQMIVDRDKWLFANNHVKEFVDDYATVSEGLYEKKVYVYEQYKNFCFNNGDKAMSNQKLKAELKRLGITDDKKYIDGVQCRVYVGMKINPSVVKPQLKAIQ